jgi:hypothetical protein
MRRPLTLLALLALLLPVAGLAAARAGEGTLSVADGRGKITVQARGAIIGRFDAGAVVITDLTPLDVSDPIVWGDDRDRKLLPDGGIVYTGKDVRFRVIGGSYRVVVRNATGIDLSVVGNGSVLLEGDWPDPGVYSLDGEDCRVDRASCKPLPRESKRLKLGSGPDRSGPDRSGPGAPTP